MTSQQVSWWSVHEWVQPYLDEAAGSWPMAGSPEWCALDDDDPRKIAAVLDAGQHHALRVEIGQQQLAEASRAVSAYQPRLKSGKPKTPFWSAIATEIYYRRGAYIPRVIA